MTREEAWEEFLERHQKKKEEKNQEFWKKLQQEVPRLLDSLRTGLEELERQAETREKQEWVYFYGSLLRCDIINRTYLVLLQGMGEAWYLEEEPLETTFSLDFLFSDLEELWEELLLDSSSYRGKLSKWDVDFFMEEMALEQHQMVGSLLRYLLRDLEEEPNWKKIPKGEAAFFYWGEYRGESERVFSVDRRKKTRKEWEEVLRRREQEEEALVGSDWYQIELEGIESTGKNLSFLTMEESTLSKMNFAGANLTGARFLHCTLKECNFQGARLQQVLFSHCIWEGNSLKEAKITGCLVTEDMIPFFELEPEQQTEVWVWEDR